MRVAVVGAGISGLTVAEQLVRQVAEVVVFEKSRPGGLAAGFPHPRAPGVFLDKFHHHVFAGDRRVIEAVDEHGLGGDLVWLPSSGGLIAQGRAWPFDSLLDLLCFTPMGSFGQRLRMALNLRRLARTEDWQSLDQIPAAESFARRGNLPGYRGLCEPLLRQKFADAYEDIPAAVLWGRLRRRARSRRAGGENLGYLRGGFQRLADAMVASIRQGGGEVRSGQVVGRLRPGRRPELVAAGRSERFDRVVWTAGLPQLLRALESPLAEFRRKAEGVEYLAVTQLILILRQQQSDFYRLDNLDPRITFSGLVEHTNLAPPEVYHGEHVLYVVNDHRPGDSRFAAARNKDLLRYHLPSLRRILPGFRDEDVLRVHCCRSSCAAPLCDLGFAERMPPYQGWLENVDVCGVAQIYPVDRNMNDCIENALRYVRSCYDTEIGGTAAARRPGSHEVPPCQAAEAA